MSSSHLMPLRLFSTRTKLLSSKLIKLSITNRHALSGVCSLPATVTRAVPFLASHSHASERLQCFYLWRFRQCKSMWPRSATYSSSAVTENQPESAATARPRHDLMTHPFKKERIESQTLLREIFARKGDTEWADEDWVHLAESLPLTSRSMWEVICMHTLYIDKNISVARKLMRYLESRTDTPSHVLLIFYIGVLGETSEGSEDQENETYKYYELLLSRTDILDAASIEVLISGLSMTKYYLECLKLLKICQETSVQSSSSLIKLLSAGIRNKNMSICQFALKNFEEEIEPTAFISFVSGLVEECLAASNQDGLTLVMDFIQKHRLLLPKTVLEAITDSFNRHQPNQWAAKYGFIHHRSGHCTVCGHQVKRSEISDNDFKAIQSVFLEQVIVGRNVFFKTSPDEMESYISFVKRMGPFDVVIDGLNMIYRGAKKSNQQQLDKAVEYFSSLGKKILILGSRMLKGHIRNIKKMVPMPAVYMTNTTKADDAFFLYAALHSGKNTLVVSCDKLRDHKFLLDPSLRHVFLQWIMIAQVSEWYISQSGEFGIGKRHFYLLGPAQDKGGWHMPMMDVDQLHPFGKFSVLCLRNKAIQAASPRTYNGNRRPGTEKLTQVVSTTSHFSETKDHSRSFKSHSRPIEDHSSSVKSHPRSAENWQRQKNMATLRNDKNSAAEVSKKFDRKLKQSKNINVGSEKEWFDN